MADQYDPDRMNADDVDITDPAAIDAWLDHPNTKALHEDLGRAFRQEPVEYQQAKLQRVLEGDEARLQALTEHLEREHSPEVRQALETLQDTMRRNIEAARLRILELDVAGPDTPA